MVKDVVHELVDWGLTLQDDHKIDVTGLVFEHEAELVHVVDFRCELCQDRPEDEVDEAVSLCERSALPDEE